MGTAATILLVEDNEDDVFLMTRALTQAGINNPVRVAEDGRAAIHYLSGQGVFEDRAAHPLPALILLDLKLPITSGFEVLSWIRGQAQLKALPVVVVTSSDEPADLERAAGLKADAYIVKPPAPSQLVELADQLKWHWLVRDSGKLSST
ncbi:MAG TPA: response regulator [Verrucomicrobiae bacterium]|nr:response regulator [Verrucomicrobiae bacterium]